MTLIFPNTQSESAHYHEYDYDLLIARAIDYVH